MQAVETRKGFQGDAPVCAALILCDTVSLSFGVQKVTLGGLFEIVTAFGFPASIFASVFAIFTGVIEPFDCSFEAVGYDSNPLGVRQLIGQCQVVVPPVGTTSSSFITGNIVFPVESAGTADVRVYGNGVLLGWRPITIVSGPTAPGAPT